VTIKWNPGDNSSDILEYFIEYRIVGDESWENLGSFTAIGEYWFSPEIDGQYEIRSRTVDFAGNSEDKDSGDVSLTFDRVKPSLTLAAIDSLTGSGDLILAIEYTSENLSQIKLEYARLPEGTEDMLVWNTVDEVWDNGTLKIRNLVDGYTYYFRVNPVDLADNMKFVLCDINSHDKVDEFHIICQIYRIYTEIVGISINEVPYFQSPIVPHFIYSVPH
jgi:hypothetical protein